MTTQTQTTKIRPKRLRGESRIPAPAIGLAVNIRSRLLDKKNQMIIPEDFIRPMAAIIDDEMELHKKFSNSEIPQK